MTIEKYVKSLSDLEIWILNNAFGMIIWRKKGDPLRDETEKLLIKLVRCFDDPTHSKTST